MAIQRWKMCGKVRYATETKAIRVAIGASRRSGRRLRVYRCERCGGGWHLTKKRAWKGNLPMDDDPTTPLRNEFGHRRGCPCSRCAWLGDVEAAWAT